ncbi:MAG TPA: cytochrome c-type biogenesis protein CcmH [Acidobacteriota bacterium]|nr:cytochrome c-type biogenesis protein CcmH [Acidobacteriota bacterium]
MRFPKLLALYVVTALFQATLLYAASAPDLDERTRQIATELRCVVCQNLSVADSPSDMAQQMRAIVREQIEAGKTPDQIKDFFVSKYGEWVLLKPKTTGVSALLWILPYVVLVFGILAALWFVHRWVKQKKLGKDLATQPPLTEQTRSVMLQQDLAPPDIEDDSPRAQLLREGLRLREELTDLEFDFQSGKLSESDYGSLKQDIESKVVVVMQQIGTLPAESKLTTPAIKSSRANDEKTPPSTHLKHWQLVGGGIFLMLFGLALGVMLTKSIRPRAGEGDTMTGDFLTGTTPANSEAGAALAEGKQAFERQEYPKAIEAFKKVLATDPNNPEAHSYMGFILMQAGHGDGALMAFEKALSQAPRFPMAMWGKGMVLYQEKKDFAGARAIFEQLLTMMPPGEERNEVTKVLAEIPTAGGAPQSAPAAVVSSSASSGQSISGKITIDPKLKDKIDPQAALFIIARSGTGAGGPPLAVKKIDKPTFPLDYSLSQENVMMQGLPFSGKINITVRLDKDGNPITRTPGDMTGEYKKNPAEVGTKNADVVIDQAVQ